MYGKRYPPGTVIPATEKNRNFSGTESEINEKKFETFPVGKLLPCFFDFWCFPTGTWAYVFDTIQCQELIGMYCFTRYRIS